MSKISELGPITGSNTRSEDLFVVVNLVQGDDGTKNITRKELVQAIQYEVFDRIEITGGEISGVIMTDSLIANVDISESTFDLGEITNSTFTLGDITDSNANNITITDSTFEFGDIDTSTFDNGELINSTGDNLTIENSFFNNGSMSTVEADEVTLTNSSFADGEISDSTANNITLTDSTADRLEIDGSTFSNGVIDNSQLVDFDMDLSNQFEDLSINENSYFALKNAKTGETEQFSYKQFFNEISKSTAKALKIYVDSDGDDTNTGSILQPVRSLQRAGEIALEKAGGSYSRNDINNAVHISVGPGTYYLTDSVWLPDDCSLSSSSGQYATVIEMVEGYSRSNGILVGSGCYVQGFSFKNFEIDNFDFPELGFGVAYRPGALLRRSPYIRDCTQLSNFNRLDVEPPIQPFNSKGTISDLGTEFTIASDVTGEFEVGDEVMFSSGATGFITYTSDISTNFKIYVRNIKGTVSDGDLLRAESGGVATILEVGPEDFPNPLVGRGGGCVLADRRVLDPDSLYTYVLCFGFTPRSQNGMGYVARNGAGINGIGSLSIFVRCAFYALEGGQMTLNNSGTQFGDISMRAKGSTKVFQPSATSEEILLQNTVFADTIEENAEDIIDNVVEFVTTSIGDGGLGYIGYDADKCERDSSIIVDSLGYDIVLNSNYWGRLCGITYRSPISYTVVNEQMEETSGAINHLKDTVFELFETANGEILSRAGASFDEILNILENDETNASPITFTDTGSIPRTAARELLQDNREFIAHELIDWIEDNDEFFAYDSVKCRRDTTDYILPAVKYDLMLDTNYNAITAGNAYYMATASKVVNNQKDETISAYQRLRDQTNDLIIDTSNNSVIAQESDIVFDGILDILSNGVDPLNTITFSDNVAINVNRRNARVQLQNNRNYAQDHLMGYINDTYFMYDADKCKRDVIDYILPAVQRDLLLGTNFNSIQTGIAYYSATASEVVGSQLTETSGAVAHLRDLVVNNVITDANSISRVNTALNEVIDIMNNGVISADTIQWSDPAESDKLTNGTNAKTLLQSNRTFLQEEVIAWIEDNYFAYDGTKCSRDVGLILEAVKRDMMTGSNFNSVFAGLSYRSGNAATESVINNELAQTVGAINWIKDQIIGKLSGTGSPRVTAAFNEIINIMTNGIGSASPISFGVVQNSVNTENAFNVLQLNKTFMQAEMTAWISSNYPSLTYDVAKCERDVGYLVDSISWDIKNNSNAGAVNNARMYFDNAVSILPDNQKVPTAKAFEHLAEVAYLLVQDIAVSKSAGNTQTQNLSLGDSGVAVADDVRDLMNIVSSVIRNDDFDFIPEYDEPTAEGSNFTADAIIINGLKTPTQAEVIKFIAETYNGLAYNKALCRRDVGLIVDAVSKDIEYGYNNSTVDAARYYFENAINILPIEQREPTKLAFNRLSAVSSNIVRGISVTPTTGNTESQNTTGPVANLETAQTVAALINVIADTVDDTSPGKIPAARAVKSDPNRTAARINLQTNKEFIQSEIISYINDRYLKDRYFSYDEAKCSRDVGFIVDAISHDIQYGGNSATLNAAGIYFSNAINILPEDQRKPTRYAFEHLANIIDKIVQRQLITVSKDNILTQDTSNIGANPLIAQYVKELTLIISNITDDVNSNNLPVRVDPFVNWVGDNYIQSKELIEDSVTSLSDQVIDFISTTYSGLSFPADKCRRDVGLLIDAVSHDTQYDTNYATRIVAQIYFENGVSVLPVSTRAQTADVYAYLGTLLSNIVQGNDTQNATYTGTPQILGVPSGTNAEGNFTNSLIQIVETVIRNDSLDSIPALKEPDLSWVDGELVDVAKSIDLASDELADDMVEWISSEFNVLDYNKSKCRRDVGYLLDAFSFDLNYGGNIASRWNADFYFWNNIYRIPEDQRDATAKSYKKLGQICSNIVIGNYPGQVKNGELATLIESVKVKDLANIFYETQINNDITKLPLLEEPDMTWQENKFIFAKDILKKNRLTLAEEVVRFVNSEYNFVDINLTRRDAGNLIKSLANDFRYRNAAFGDEGSQISTRTFVASLFDYNGQHVFPVFNPPISGLKYMGSVDDTGLLPAEGNKPNHAYIVASNGSVNKYRGDIYRWNGSIWVSVGENNIVLLEAFYKSWERMRDYLKSNYSPNEDHDIMINGLFNDVLIGSLLRPDTLTFGSLVESIAHQFNGASAGVNRRALPLNFRNLGAAISASASVLSEDGGRVRWSGADELNNQYFARGLKINGRTGRIEGRPFTSSVRKLARRASNSRASI